MKSGLEPAAAALCVAIGAIMPLMRPKSEANWLYFAGMILLAADGMLSHPDASSMPAFLWIKSLIPPVWLGFSTIYARGAPLDHLCRWKWGILVSLIVPASLLLLFPGGFRHASGPDTPGVLLLSGAGKVWVAILLLATLAILINLEQTFRASVGMTRWRIKYLIVGVALVFSVNVYTLSQMLLFSGWNPAHGGLTIATLLVACILMGIGVSRSGFSAFEIHPSQAILQGSITVMLAGVYFLIVGLLAQWAARAGRPTAFPIQALVILLGVVGVTVLLLSENFRSKLRRFISHHFHRPEHDFRMIWTDFTHRTSSALDASGIAKNAAEVVAESFNTLSVTIFTFAPERRELRRLSATEKQSTGDAPGITLSAAGAIKRAKPFNLEHENAEWAVELRNLCPRKFDHGGDRLVVPLVATDRLVGAMVMADRVGGTPYSHEELDLLKCIGDQLAAALLNCSLTEELLQAREMEAFQTVSSFFVHDLKNAANGLNLMLQNLPSHFDDPDFRSDTISGMKRMAGRINQLILKLGSFRREIQLIRTPCRLDHLCGEELGELAGKLNAGTSLRRSLEPVPPIELDTDAMRSVIRNLLLNASEAIDGAGEINVMTRVEDSGVAMEVADTGCGMTGGFIQTRLFKPFHSTKTSGLGIGMFQCRKIIEAHGGSISVESQPGTGSRFTVFLPNTNPYPEHEATPVSH